MRREELAQIQTFQTIQNYRFLQLTQSICCYFKLYGSLCTYMKGMTQNVQLFLAFLSKYV